MELGKNWFQFELLHTTLDTPIHATTYNCCAANTNMLHLEYVATPTEMGTHSTYKTKLETTTKNVENYWCIRNRTKQYHEQV